MVIRCSSQLKGGIGFLCMKDTIKKIPVMRAVRGEPHGDSVRVE